MWLKPKKRIMEKSSYKKKKINIIRKPSIIKEEAQGIWKYEKDY